MAKSARTTTTAAEAAIIISMCFGLFIYASLRAVALGFPSQPFTNASLEWIVITELILGLAAYVFLRTRGFAVANLAPNPTFTGCIVGIGLFFGAWLIGWLLVSPFASELSQQPIQKMIEEAKLSLSTIVAMAMVNGAYEEVFLLGFLLRGLRGYGLSIALGVMLLVRMLCHLYQGPIGPLWVMGFGVVLGVYYIRTENLWPPVFAHVLWDIVPFVFR